MIEGGRVPLKSLSNELFMHFYHPTWTAPRRKNQVYVKNKNKNQKIKQVYADSVPSLATVERSVQGVITGRVLL
jgi:hypothetical protein